MTRSNTEHRAEHRSRAPRWARPEDQKQDDLRNRIVLRNRGLYILTFEDDGPGIPVKEYNNVFRPFYKIDKGRSDSKNSVGLGMSISSDIIKSHGGKIELGKSKLGGLKIKIILPF